MVLHIALASASEDEIDSTEDTAEEAPEKKTKPARPVSDRVRRFVREYVRDRDGAAAAVRAGFARNNAPHWAAMTLRRPEVQAALQGELALRAEQAKPVAERIKDELMRIAFANPGRIARWTTSGITLVDSRDLTDDDRAAVKRVTLGPSLGTGKKRAQLFEMHDKLGALELLARMAGMLPGGKTPHFAMGNDAANERDPNEILRERLMKIVMAGKKKDEKNETG
ncbi:MAG TPA: terminase small subunit [Stellaceae bacterium]|jgi:phage terminase small subunit|nr:terminase small subunit [Stellaceae bacterium]